MLCQRWEGGLEVYSHEIVVVGRTVLGVTCGPRIQNRGCGYGGCFQSPGHAGHPVGVLSVVANTNRDSVPFQIE